MAESLTLSKASAIIFWSELPPASASSQGKLELGVQGDEQNVKMYSLCLFLLVSFKLTDPK